MSITQQASKSLRLFPRLFGFPEEITQPFKPIVKVYEMTVLKKPNGDEEMLNMTETIYPMEITPEDIKEADDTVEDIKDNKGLLMQVVLCRLVMLTNQVTSIKRSELLPNGEERDIEENVVEESSITAEEPTKTNHVVSHRPKEPSDKESAVEHLQDVIPLKIIKKFESEPELEEFVDEDQSISVVRRKCVKIVQKKAIRRVVKPVDDQDVKPEKSLETKGVPEESLEPVEDTIEELVEPSKVTIVKKTIVCEDGTTDTVEESCYEMPESAEPTVEEEKDPQGNVIRRIVRKPVCVVSKRIVYRKVILATDGTEEGVEEKVEELTPSDEIL